MSLAGVLQRLDISAAGKAPLQYTLRLGEDTQLLNDWLGAGVELTFTGEIICQACAARTPKSYGQGYCYDCFKTLARCDLCVVSPLRCHYHQGTCREPAWGESFCMQPHLVYLANTSGPKVGITRSGAQEGRWRDQGACQALTFIETGTRQGAGKWEARIARQISDKTDWRRMLAANVKPFDLIDLARQIQISIQAALEQDSDARLVEPYSEVRLEYPILRQPELNNYDPAINPTIRDQLVGMKGQYLLFRRGVLNVRRYTGYRVGLRRVEISEKEIRAHDPQRDLFN